MDQGASHLGVVGIDQMSLRQHLLRARDALPERDHLSERTWGGEPEIREMLLHSPDAVEPLGDQFGAVDLDDNASVIFEDQTEDGSDTSPVEHDVPQGTTEACDAEPVEQGHDLAGIVRPKQHILKA